MMRFRVYKAYDPSHGTALYVGQTVTGGHSSEFRSVDGVAEWVRGFRVGLKVLRTDLVVQFKVEDDIGWLVGELLPRRYAPLSLDEQDRFFRILAGK